MKLGIFLLLGFFMVSETFANKQKVISLFGTYSASLKDTQTSSDFYDGFGYGGALGLASKSREYFIAVRNARQRSNYTNIDDPQFMDTHLRLGFRYEAGWRTSVFPVFEVAGDLVLLGGNGSGIGYGVSGGMGLGLRLGRRVALRSISELNMLKFSYRSMRRRFFNQRLDLAFKF